MAPTWDPPGSCRPQVGPMSAPWILLSVLFTLYMANAMTTDDQATRGARASAALDAMDYRYPFVPEYSGLSTKRGDIFKLSTVNV